MKTLHYLKTAALATITVLVLGMSLGVMGIANPAAVYCTNTLQGKYNLKNGSCIIKNAQLWELAKPAKSLPLTSEAGAQ